MNIVCCDRCKKNITNKPKYKVNIKWAGIKGDGVCYPIPQDEDKQLEMDFCVDCYNAFKEFVNYIEEGN